MQAIDVASFTHDSGFMWAVDLPYGIPMGDDYRDGCRSGLRVLEDGVELPHPHAGHGAIRDIGQGRYAHWEWSLHFSTSDNSDPRGNGRRYSLLVEDGVGTDWSAEGRQAIYALQVAFDWYHQLRLRGIDIRGKTVLELGPGRDFAAQLVLAGAGAQMIVADRFLAPWTPRHADIYRRVARLLGDGFDGGPLLRAAEQEGHDGCLVAIDQPAEALTAIADGSVDVVLSNAVLEHLVDLGRAAQELARITRVGGHNLHRVDLRDHHDFARPLEHLLLTEAEFARSQVNPAAPHHRGCQWRSSQFADAFTAASFRLRQFDETLFPSAEYLEEFMARLRRSDSPYRDWPPEQLAAIGLFIWACRQNGD